MQLDQCKNPVLHAAVSKLGGVRATARVLDCSRGAVDQWLAEGGVYALLPAFKLITTAWPEIPQKQQLELLSKLARPPAKVRRTAKRPDRAVVIPTVEELLGGTNGDQ